MNSKSREPVDSRSTSENGTDLESLVDVIRYSRSAKSRAIALKALDQHGAVEPLGPGPSEETTKAAPETASRSTSDTGRRNSLPIIILAVVASPFVLCALIAAVFLSIRLVASVVDSLPLSSPTEAPELDAQWYVDQGNFRRSGGSYAEAIELFDTAIELDSDHAEAFYGRGWTHYSMDEYELAAVDLNRAVALDSDNASALNLLAWTQAYHLNRDLDLALGHATRAVQISSDANRLDTLALVHLKLGNYQDSLTRYNMALSLDPTLEISYWGRGQVHEALGNSSAAVINYEKYLSLDPDGTHAEEVRQRINLLQQLDS